MDDVSASPQSISTLMRLSSPPTQKDSPTQHNKYYIPSGDVVFLVESNLFRVHRYFFLRESPLFCDMLTLPSPSGKTDEGTSDENPICLPQVTAAEFEQFLWVFYNPKYSVYDASVDTWTVILQLAHRWQFPEIRQLAFRELDRLSVPPVIRVTLAEEYDAGPAWRMKALAELGARPEPLTLAEGEQLGLEMALKVAELRERIRGRNDRMRSRSPVYEVRCGTTHRRSRSRRSHSPDDSVIIHPTGSMPTWTPLSVPPAAPVIVPYIQYVPPQRDIQDVRAIFGLE